MGSLVPGWETDTLGPPKDMQDYEEPHYPKSPRSTSTGPPKLGRISCPTPLHQAPRVASPPPPFLQRPSMDKSKDKKSTIGIISRPSLKRTSISNPSTPSSVHHTQGTELPLFQKLLQESKNSAEELSWCDRFDSAALNAHPDDPADLNEWRHGSFRMDDPAGGGAHILHTMPPKKD